MGRQGVADVPLKTSWRAKAAVKKECTVYQVVWTVYVHGRKYCIVFHMVRARLKPLCIVANWVAKSKRNIHHSTYATVHVENQVAI